jgi:hypothetical protein
VAAIATISIGVAMTYFGKTRWDRLANVSASDDR